MIGFIKKRIQHLKDLPKHKSYLPKDTDDPVYNLSELVALSKRYGAGFKVKGDHQKFTIVSNAAVTTGLAVMLLVCLVFIVALAITSNEPVIWLILAASLPILMLALKLGPLIFYNITVDTHTQRIIVKSNNTFGFIGKWIRPGFEISFNRFKRLSREGKVRRSWAGEIYTTHYVNRIYIEYDQQKRAVIDFKDEINYKIFIICLTRLIQKNIAY